MCPVPLWSELRATGPWGDAATGVADTSGGPSGTPDTVSDTFSSSGDPSLTLRVSIQYEAEEALVTRRVSEG